MFGLTPIPMYAIAVLIFTNLVTVILWQQDAHKLEETKQVAQAQEAVVKHVEAQQERITLDVSNAWSDALNRERAAWRLRLSRSGQMSGISQAPRSIDAIPADALPLAAECAETTLMLVSLQGWITRQQDVNSEVNK